MAIKSFDENGNELSAVTSLGITGTHDWQRLSISMMRVPTNTRYLTIYCNLRNASGTAWFDCLQLEEYDCANDFNALQNGDFSSNDYWYTNDNQAITVQDNTVVINGEAGAYEEPTTVAVDDTESENNDKSDLELPTYSITTNYAVPDSYIFTYDEYGNVIGEYHGTVDKVIKKVYLAETEDATSTGNTTATTATNTNIPSDTTASHNVLDNKYIYQNVQVGRAGVVFRLSGEAQADSVPLSNENRTFGIALNIYYKNSTIPETHYQEFNASTTRRQSIAMSVTPNDMEKEINYVAFAFVYGYNKNRMTIYNAMLNVSSIPLQTTDETTDSESSSNNTSNLDYDGYIYCEAVQESKNTNHEYIEHTKTYDSTGNYVTSETNQAGYAVGYTYDSNGNITSSTDAKGKVTNYTYDLTGNVTEVNSYNVENQYFYNTAGMLSSINHNSFTYQFNYDVYNNLVSTTIGDTALATNTYDENNGVLEKTTYANGDYLEYMYDPYDRIIRISGEAGTHSMFVYNKRGLVAKVVDVMNNRTTYYYYDLNGNVEKKYCQTEFGDMLYYVTTNTDGEIIEKTSVHGYEKTIVRGTLNGESYVESDGITVSRKTDDFDRLTKVTTTRDGYSNKFYTNYEYAKVGTTNATTNLVSKVTQKKGDSQLYYFQYSYDKNGNITGIIKNNKEIARYTYDKFNQLLTDINFETKTYTYYYYDNAGNITKTREYGLNTSAIVPDGLIEEVTYTYTDTTWKDKLSSYDGQTITYDANGNPLSYRDGMSFEWENGRILKKITVGDKQIEMYYDSNGTRIRKEDDDLNINYFYDSNNNLTALSYEENTVYFYYDSEGLPTSMSFDDTMYYYIKNLQGDIVSIVNQNGDTVVTYTYDAFGKVTSKTDTTVYDIADLNPFRYRGYIYDNETGLYYLKSRYYDPETGRFINADIYCDTQSNILGTNMFTYCNNNPVNQVDPEGTDAIWLQDLDAVFYLGHTSLLLEDALGVWWFTYWGDSYMVMYPYGNGTVSEFKSYINYGFDPRPNHNYYVKTYYAGTFDAMLYFDGNFTYSLLLYFGAIYAQGGSKIYTKDNGVGLYADNIFLYNVFAFNCVQSCIDALMLGDVFMYDSYFRYKLSFLRNKMVPNLIYAEMSIAFPWSLIIFDSWYL